MFRSRSRLLVASIGVLVARLSGGAAAGPDSSGPSA